jgi:hypothetical protein
MYPNTKVQWTHRACIVYHGFNATFSCDSGHIYFFASASLLHKRANEGFLQGLLGTIKRSREHRVPLAQSLAL